MDNFIPSHETFLIKYVKYETKSQSSTRCFDSPFAVQEVSLHKPKFGVWCARSARKIIRTVFFQRNEL